MDDYFELIKTLESEILALKSAQPLPGAFVGFNYFYVETTSDLTVHLRITYDSSDAVFCVISALYAYALLPQDGNTQDLYVTRLFDTVAVSIMASAPIIKVERIE